MTSNEMNGSIEENREDQCEDQHEDTIVKIEDIVVEEAPAAEEKVTEEENEGNRDDDGDDIAGLNELELPNDIANTVRKIGLEAPSPIQAITTPTLMNGRDIVGLAQTDTSGTTVFALPILVRIDRSVRTPQVLMPALTRELTLQVTNSLQSFADHLGKVQVLLIYGGQSYGMQLPGLRRDAQTTVGMPGCIISHLERDSLDIFDLRFLVLDEADEMLRMDFQEDVECILIDAPDNRQVALFSATVPASIYRLSRQYPTGPEEITAKSRTRTAGNIRQRSLMVSYHNKLDMLACILKVEEFEAMTMFVRTKHGTEKLAEKLCTRGFSTATIGGDTPQILHERTIDQLKDGRLGILVATDAAVRDLNVDRISRVINYGIPHGAESYIRHISRTGRADRSGEVLLFVTPREGRLPRLIERITKSQLHEIKLPTASEVSDSRRQGFVDGLIEAPTDSQAPVFREPIGEYAEEHDTPLADIAAAVAAQAQPGNFLMKELSRGRYHDRNRDRFDRDRNHGRDNRSRGERGRGGRADLVGFGREGITTYRINVGRHQYIRPGAIVGAIVSEGNLPSKNSRHIDIRGNHTLVELPVSPPQEVTSNLSGARIFGQLIGLKPDDGTSVDDSDDYYGSRGDYRGNRRNGGRGRGGYYDGRGYGRDDRRGGGHGHGSYRGNFNDGDDSGSRGRGHGGYHGDRDDRRGGYRGRRR